MCNLVI